MIDRQQKRHTKRDFRCVFCLSWFPHTIPLLCLVFVCVAFVRCALRPWVPAPVVVCVDMKIHLRARWGPPCPRSTRWQAMQRTRFWQSCCSVLEVNACCIQVPSLPACLPAFLPALVYLHVIRKNAYARCDIVLQYAIQNAVLPVQYICLVYSLVYSYWSLSDR